VEAWKGLFENWPSDLPRKGVIVVRFGEQIPFENFHTGPQMILLERRAPDALGARVVACSYSEVSALKFVDPLKGKAISAMGFQQTQPERRKTDREGEGPVRPPHP
jgi:hypothetical protein